MVCPLALLRCRNTGEVYSLILGEFWFWNQVKEKIDDQEAVHLWLPKVTGWYREFENKNFFYLLFVFGVAILTGTVLVYLHIRTNSNNDLAEKVPQTLAGLSLSQVITGQEAIESIHQLHGRDFPLKGGAVASYGAQNATLWVAGTGGESDAAALTELMKVRIAEGRSPFVAQDSFKVEGSLVYALEGLGQVHYYWQSDSLVLWLAVDWELAISALQQAVEYYAQQIGEI